MRRLLFLLVAAGLSATLLTAPPATAAGSPPVDFPAKPKGLPAPVKLPTALDPTPRYMPQFSCQPGTPAGVTKLRALVLKTYGVGGAGNTARTCVEGTSEHSDGRAWDWMVNVKNAKEKAAAANFLAWLTADGGKNARRLGVMYVIYNKKIWGAYRAGDGWRPSSGHTDHIHVSFSWNGARGTTSFWTGKVHPVDYGPCAVFAGQGAVMRWTARTTPCAAPVGLPRTHSYAIAKIGSKTSVVATGQKLLKVKQTKTFDNATWMAVRAYQNENELPVTGMLDKPTWGSLVPSKITADALKGYTPKTAAQYGLKNHPNAVMRQGYAGRATMLLQLALGLKPSSRNGYYSFQTVEAVKKLQAANGLKQTGTVSGPEWKILAGA